MSFFFPSSNSSAFPRSNIFSTSAPAVAIQQHIGVECNGKLRCWGKTLQGDRWKCLSCFDLDFCSECVLEHRDNEKTSHHILLCIPAGKSLHTTSHSLLTTLTLPLAYLSQSVDLRQEQSRQVIQSAQERMAKGGDLSIEAKQLKQLTFQLLQEQHQKTLRDQHLQTKDMLDEKFFRIVGADRETDNKIYQAYIPRYDCAVLTSDVDGKAIAAIQIIPAAVARQAVSNASSSNSAAAAAQTTPFSALWDVNSPTASNVSSSSTSTKAIPRFQSVFASSSSSSSIRFAVILTNLLPSQRLGMLLRLCSSSGELLGNGLPTNNINVLSAGQSIIVDADANGLALMLQEVKELKSHVPSIATSVSFADEQKRSNKNQCGSYQKAEVYLVDEHQPPEWMKLTRWAISDVIIRHMPPPQGAFPFDLFTAPSTSISSPTQSSSAFRNDRIHARSLIPAGSSTADFGGAYPAHTTSAMPPPHSFPAFPISTAFSQPSVSHLPSSSSSFPFSASASASALASSNVAEIIRGDRVKNFANGVRVNGEFTLPLQTCILGFSFQKAELIMKAESLSYATILERVTERLKLLRQAGWLCVSSNANSGGWNSAIAVKVFSSEHCVVCLDGLPDCVLLPCGHKCVHASEGNNLQTCPLCRKIVSARLKD